MFKKMVVLQRGNEIQRELSEFEFERKRADSNNYYTNMLYGENDYDDSYGGSNL